MESTEDKLVFMGLGEESLGFHRPISCGSKFIINPTGCGSRNAREDNIGGKSVYCKRYPLKFVGLGYLTRLGSNQCLEISELGTDMSMSCWRKISLQY